MIDNLQMRSQNGNHTCIVQSFWTIVWYMDAETGTEIMPDTATGYAAIQKHEIIVSYGRHRQYSIHICFKIWFTRLTEIFFKIKAWGWILFYITKHAVIETDLIAMQSHCDPETEEWMKCYYDCGGYLFPCFLAMAHSNKLKKINQNTNKTK